MTEPTEEQWVARCRTAYRMGLLTVERMALLRTWIDIVGRLEGGQINTVVHALADEQRRTEGFGRTLAADTDGYAVMQLAAILAHPCQQCAEDDRAWHTRTGFCSHQPT